MQRFAHISGGRTSMFMALDLKQKYPDIVFLFQNTGAERHETYEYLNRCDKAFNLNIVWLEYTKELPLFKVVSYETASRNNEPFDQLIEKRKNYLPNQSQRFCTMEMKVLTARRYIRSLGLKEWTSYVGFRYDEPHRKRVDARRTKIITEHMCYPLFDDKVTVRDIGAFWRSHNMQPLDLKLPMLPNGKTIGGNCVGCFMKSEYEQSMLCKHEPEKVKWLMDKEEQCGGTFKKDVSWKERSDFVGRQGDLSDDMESELYCQSDYGGCTEF